MQIRQTQSVFGDGSRDTMEDRLATLLPFPRVVRRRPGHFGLGPEAAISAARGAEQAADAVRRVLGTLPWPPTAGQLTSRRSSPSVSQRNSPPGRQADEQPGVAVSGRAVTTASAVRQLHSREPGGGEILVNEDASLPCEAYRLLIAPSRIRITAGGVAGAFYAAQTVRQLLPDDAWRTAPLPGPRWAVPCAEIEDAPALAWRGAHLDVARHFFPKHTLLRFIDMLAAHKLNRFHLHLTDDQGWRIESRRFPALHHVGSHRPRTRISPRDEEPVLYDEVPHGGYYTLADLAEITAYAAQRMVEIVPEIDIPGHTSALLAALPELGSGTGTGAQYRVAADWGIFPNLLAPLPATAQFLQELFGEVLGAIPARYVHIGGDECVLTDWQDDKRIERHRRSLGLASPAALHAYFLRQVADMLADRFGVRAVVWDEGFASAALRDDAGGETSEATGDGAGYTERKRLAACTDLREDTVVMAWRGMAIARRAADAGHDVIAAPVVPTYFDYYQAADDRERLAIGGPVRIEDVAGFSPVPPDWPDDVSRHLLGTQFQVWTEYISDGRALDYMVFPRACAFAEVAWSGRASSWPGAPVAQAALAPQRLEVAMRPPPLRQRVAAHLGRLAAAGVEFRPLHGPHPWQHAGSGPRRHRAGSSVADVAAQLEKISRTAGGT
jgi:hexosaminidase